MLRTALPAGVGAEKSGEMAGGRFKLVRWVNRDPPARTTKESEFEMTKLSKVAMLSDTEIRRLRVNIFLLDDLTGELVEVKRTFAATINEVRQWPTHGLTSRIETQDLEECFIDWAQVWFEEKGAVDGEALAFLAAEVNWNKELLREDFIEGMKKRVHDIWVRIGETDDERVSRFLLMLHDALNRRMGVFGWMS